MDRLNSSIAQFGVDNVVNASMAGGNDLSQAYYASSYAATMYLNHKLEDNNSTMQDFLNDIETNSFDQALQNTIGLNRTDFETDFKTNGASFLSNLAGVKTSLLADFESYFPGSEVNMVDLSPYFVLHSLLDGFSRNLRYFDQKYTQTLNL